jgi:hypothetical protein
MVVGSLFADDVAGNFFQKLLGERVETFRVLTVRQMVTFQGTSDQD